MRIRLGSFVPWLLMASASAQQDARTLFLAHCASCHGESGDGKGTAQLDRPARSFKDGGFSYGNTPEALLRTITFGIPGTPMPAAPSVLTYDQKRALADYVISLGPPGVVVKPGESVLVVHDKPLVVRGKLPPIAPDMPERPRGLLIGTPDGLTFEYRTDDVRLLGVRQGGFVDRRDWVGRGGDALQPLGKIVWLAGKGDPGWVFQGFEAQFASTWIRGARCGLTYRLVSKRGFFGGTVEEEVVGIPSGFERRFRILGGEGCVVKFAEGAISVVSAGPNWRVLRREDGVFEATAAIVPGEPVNFEGEPTILLPGGTDFRIRTILAAKWDDKIQTDWLREIER